MQVINLFGGPGSGKSTTAAGLFYHMKLRHMSVELVTEYAKDLVWEGQLDYMMDKQEDIFIEQHRRLRRLRDNVEYAIVDSPLLLSAVYSKINHQEKKVEPWPALEEFIQFVTAVNNTYNNTNIFLNRPTCFETNGRDRNLEQSQDIDQLIKTTLSELDEQFLTIHTNQYTIDLLLDQFKKRTTIF